MHEVKHKLIRDMAAYIRDRGLGDASLRPLARAAGTSDRMLIYYFGTKKQLLADVLGFLAGELANSLEAALPTGPMRSHAELITKVVEVLRTADMQGYFRVWLEIIAKASQSGSAYVMLGASIIDGFAGWLEKRIPETDAEPGKTAMAMLTLIEGVIVMDAAGRSSAADEAVRMLFKAS